MNADAARAHLVDLIARQAEDEVLWFDPVIATENHLQTSLRELHRAAEAFLLATQPHSGALLKGHS